MHGVTVFPDIKLSGHASEEVKPSLRTALSSNLNVELQYCGVS